MTAHRLWFDTEFIDTGDEIILLSIGVVRDDGATYYAEPAGAPIDEADEWVRENVIPKMTRFSGLLLRDGQAIVAPRDSPTWREVVKSRRKIAEELVEFAGASPQWWAYVSAFDWVALSQLYGPLVKRPQGWPFGAFDIAQQFCLAGMSGKPTDWVPAPVHEHHALADAQWDRALWQRIQDHCGDDNELTALVWP